MATLYKKLSGGALLLALAFAAATAGAGPRSEPEAMPALREPLAFDHEAHGEVFAKVRVGCVDCHPIGLSVRVDGVSQPQVEDLPRPLSVCHGCHRGMVKGAPRKAPGTCMLCHANREDLIPPSHAVDWLTEHDDEARAGIANCRDCHEPSTCVSCHERRGPGARTPHPPAWLNFHGIEARLDPFRCSTCHAGESCAECHASGEGPW